MLDVFEEVEVVATISNANFQTCICEPWKKYIEIANQQSAPDLLYYNIEFPFLVFAGPIIDLFHAQVCNGNLTLGI